MCFTSFPSIVNMVLKVKDSWTYVIMVTLCLYVFLFLFFFFCFLGLHLRHMEVPRLDAGNSCQSCCSCQPTPQPQQLWIWAASVTYTTDHGSAGSPTHWARPGIKPAFSWVLVRFISAVPQRELLHVFLNITVLCKIPVPHKMHRN